MNSKERNQLIKMFQWGIKQILNNEGAVMSQGEATYCAKLAYQWLEEDGYIVPVDEK